MECTEAKPDNAISIPKVLKNQYEVIYTDRITYKGEIKKV